MPCVQYISSSWVKPRSTIREMRFFCFFIVIISVVLYHMHRRWSAENSELLGISATSTKLRKCTLFVITGWVLIVIWFAFVSLKSSLARTIMVVCLMKWEEMGAVCLFLSFPGCVSRCQGIFSYKCSDASAGRVCFPNRQKGNRTGADTGLIISPAKSDTIILIT